MIPIVSKLVSGYWRRGWDSNPWCVAASPVFKTGSLNHSDTSPNCCESYHFRAAKSSLSFQGNCVNGSNSLMSKRGKKNVWCLFIGISAEPAPFHRPGLQSGPGRGPDSIPALAPPSAQADFLKKQGFSVACHTDFPWHESVD